jgi:hypothetical protein
MNFGQTLPKTGDKYATLDGKYKKFVEKRGMF